MNVMLFINSFLPEVNDRQHISTGSLHAVNNLNVETFFSPDSTELFYKFFKNMK